MKLPNDKILVFDIETTSTDIDQATLRYFGAYSYRNGKRIYLRGDDYNTIERIKDIIKEHDVIVGFNIKKYDIPVLNKYEVFFQGKVIIDLWEVLSEPKLDLKTRVRTGGKGRGAFMGLNLASWSLASIMKALSLGDYKTEGFDYNILKKQPNEWTKEEEKIIVEYLGQDITVTKKLFEYTNNFFYPLTEHLSEHNIKRFTYITASIASVAYKVMCHEAGLEEEYGEGEAEGYEGGYVRYPTEDTYVGDVLCLDFASLYPSIFRGFNLASPATEDLTSEQIFSGNDFFTGIKGEYNCVIQGKIEGVLAKLFALRKIYKANGDKREYLIKIIINSFYGITPKPTFKNVYTPHGAEDCTYVGRVMIKHVADTFTKNGYKVLYGDTDSVYIGLEGHTKEEALKLAKELNEFFKSKMPFPHEDFGLALDAEITAIFFFKEEGGDEYKKKNYIYIYKDKKSGEERLKIKGLPIIKSNASRVAKLILDKYLKKEILFKKKIQFHSGWLFQLIYHELEQDLHPIAQVYKIREPSYYERNPSSLYAQISRKYGQGVIELLPLKAKKEWKDKDFGIGKDKKYITIKEFQDLHFKISDIDLTTTVHNLEPFTKPEQQTLDNF
jgi:DNA polymerase elongation subunit (family B)